MPHVVLNFQQPNQDPKATGPLSEFLKDAGADAVEKQADSVVQAGLAGWWQRADEDSKAAVLMICAGAAIGPLGQGLLAGLGILFGDPALPSSKQIYAVFWLLVLTAPVAAFAVIVIAG